MQNLEAELKALREAMRQVLRALGQREELPLAMSYQRAAKELEVSLTTLKGLVREGELLPCVVGRRKRIPRDELLALVARREEQRKPPRRSGGRPKAQRFDPKAEAAAGRADLRAARLKR